MRKEERRFFERVILNIDGCVYCNNTEFFCIIKDICEDGLAIFINNNDMNNFSLKDCLKINDIVKFSFLGNYKSLKNEKISCIVTGECQVKRINVDENGIVLGCILKNDNNFNYFVKNKKIEIFLKKLKNPLLV